MSELGSEARREANAGIASVSQLMQSLETRENNRVVGTSLSNHVEDHSIAEASNQMWKLVQRPLHMTTILQLLILLPHIQIELYFVSINASFLSISYLKVRLFLQEESPSQVGLSSQNHLEAKRSLLLHPGRAGFDDILPLDFEGTHVSSQFEINPSQIPVIIWKTIIS